MTTHANASGFRRYVQPLIDSLADVERQCATALGAQATTGTALPTELAAWITEEAQEANALRLALQEYRAGLPRAAAGADAGAAS